MISQGDGVVERACGKKIGKASSRRPKAKKKPKELRPEYLEPPKVDCQHDVGKLKQNDWADSDDLGAWGLEYDEISNESLQDPESTKIKISPDVEDAESSD